MRRAVTALAALLLATSVLTGAAVAAEDDHEGFVYEGDQLVLHSGPGQSVTGQTHLEPGTVVHVRIASTVAEEPFLIRDDAAVEEDGSFTANFSLDGFDPQANLELTAVVKSTGEEFDTVIAEVNPCNGQCPEETVDHDPEPSEETDADGGPLLNRTVVPVEQGETAEIPVVLDNASSVTLAIGSEDAGYQIDASVRDGNGDGRVDVLFDTTAAGHEPATLAVANDSDSLNVTREENRLGSVMDSGPYDLRLYRGDSSDDPATVGTLDVRDGDVDDEGLNPKPAGKQPFGFEDGDVFTVYSGEVAPMNLSLANETTATLTVEDDRTGLTVVTTVRDGNGDGRVPLRFDTAVGATDSPVRVTQAADEVVDVTVNRGNVTAAMPDGVYDLGVHRGGTTSGDEDVIGTLAVREFSGDRTPDGDGPTTAEGNGTDTLTTGDTATAQSTSAAEPSTPTNDAVLVGGGAIGLVAALGVASRLFA